jgi:hypothetical protein
MPMPTSSLARLGGFRTELHACFTRRADALFELGDALLCAQTALPSLPHLSLEPVCRRGWGSIYDALARSPRSISASAVCSMPSRWASVAGSSSPALAIAWVSSKRVSSWSRVWEDVIENLPS